MRTESNDQALPDVSAFAGLTQDSRAVRTGYLFAALSGGVHDGRDYISDALQRGASAVLAQNGTALPDGAEALLIEDENPRRMLSLLAAKFYGAQPDYVAAVTGTNGKSSAVFFAQQLWQALGEKSAFLGTLGVGRVGKMSSGTMTTPDPVALHETLAGLAEKGVTHLAMEASSHGLSQCRLDGVRVSAGGFTSFSRDHMDYHETMEAYLESKAHLFSGVVKKGGAAVLNADIPEYKMLERSCGENDLYVYSYGQQGKDIKLVARDVVPLGQDVVLQVLGHAYDFVFPLVGEFQLMNALCAFGLVLAEAPADKDRTERLVQALEGLQGAPGRMQRACDESQDFAVYVDYAHTPDALEAALAALRPHTNGRLICLFGCGGDRDQGKRFQMGEIAARLADAVIVTDDNPRSENPASIRSEIIRGAGDVKDIQDIEGRRKAIRFAIGALGSGDVLVVAGKGHEQGQVFNGFLEPFDDVEVVNSVIMELKSSL
jgi:UDP-N-acetylmuramoyl-L-alanyl-D-glutamate--2,6-diaminopimelate ligase